MGAKKRVALITGGASGMGLAVAERLSNIGWNIAVVDLNEQQSEPVLALLGPSAIFVRANVVHYDELLVAFQKTRDHFGSIDFVFANAGIIGRVEFYDVAMQWPPKAPMLAVQDICLTGVIYTSYLAMHFMRQNHKGEGVIVMTASAASLYATPDLPLYTSSKHGVLGLMRSMSLKLAAENIRVNCILPGAIRTALHSNETWSQFAEDDFTPVEQIVSTVLDLVNDASANGMAMEVSKGEVFNRAQPSFANNAMRKIMTGSSY